MQKAYLYLPHETWVESCLERLIALIQGWSSSQANESAGEGWVRHLYECHLTNIIPSRACLTLILHGAKHLQEPQEKGANRIRVLSRGSIIFFPAGEPISCTNMPDKDSDYLAFTISFSEETLLQTKLRLSLNEPAIEENISSRLLSSIETFLDFLATGDQTLALMQQEQILYLLLRCGINPFSFQQDLATKIRNLIETDPTATWTASEVAEQLHMSERTLRRHLKTANLRCSALIRISRLHVGLALLQKGSQRVGEIAYACGYESASRFSERFREHFNVTPAEILHGKAIKTGARMAE